MNKLERYLAKTIMLSTSVVLLVLLGIQSFIQLAAQLQDVGKGNYQWIEAFLFVPLMLPSDLYLLFPMAALLGSLIGLSRLASTSELIVMRTSGMSLFQITKTIMMTAIIMLIFTSIVGEVLGPKARDKALTMKSMALSKGQILKTKHGVWLRNGHNFLHIDEINTKKMLSGVTLYQIGSNNQLVTSRVAKKAMLVGKKWQFHHVRDSHFYPDHIQTRESDVAFWPVKIDTRMATLSDIDPNQQSLRKLYRYVKFRKHSGLGQGAYEFVFWKRVFQPLATLVIF